MGVISLSSLKKKTFAVLGKELHLDLSKLIHASLAQFGTWSTCFLSQLGRLGACWQPAEQDAVTMALEHAAASQLPQWQRQPREPRRGSSR